MSDTMQKLRDYLAKGRTQKFGINGPHFSSKKRAHIQRFLDAGGLKNKFLFLPVDHGIEHGPSDFLSNPESVDSEYMCELALAGKYSGLVFHIGLAQKYWQKDKYRSSVPLILKLNGKTNIPSDDDAFSPLTSTVSDAIKIGADAVGYTLYVGSPRQDEDMLQFVSVRQEAEEAGLPIVMWAYPRGSSVEEKGGRDCFAAVAYAARVANELGADITKINAPKPPKTEGERYDEKGIFKSYNDLLELSSQEQMAWAVRSAGSTGVLVSGGSKLGDDDLLAKVQTAVNAGVDGLIFGRNMFQRSFEGALEISQKVKDILKKS